MTASVLGRSATLRVATLNIHKGLSQFNRRLVIHELRDGLRALDADIVFLQEVQGTNRRHAARFADCPSQPQYEFLAAGGWQHAYGRNALLCPEDSGVGSGPSLHLRPPLAA